MSPFAPSPRGYSRIHEFQQCEQLWDYEANGIPELGITTIAPVDEPDYLLIGTAFHEGMKARHRGGNVTDMVVAALETIEQHCAMYANLTAERGRISEFVAELLGSYVTKYGSENDLRPVMLPSGPAVELELEVPLPNGVLMTVRIDHITEYSGVPMIVENKTTGTELAEYFQEFEIDAKSTGYVYAARTVLKLPVESILINAVKKPRMGKDKATGRTVNPTNMAFEFDRNFTQRTDYELERWAKDTMELLDRMDAVTQQKRRPVRHTEQCINKYRRKCPYKKLCKYGPRPELLGLLRIGVQKEEVKE